MTYLENLDLYSQNETDPFFLTDLKKLSVDEQKERFGSLLSFGTGGMRGKIGAGTGRINSYMVRRLSFSISFYLKEIKKIEKPSVVIAFDSRNFSRSFALQTALVYATQGFKVHLFKNERGVPLLSFAVRQLKTDIGVIITASHNPPIYNGYKLYNSEGGQIVEPEDSEIMAIKAHPSTLTPVLNEEEAVKMELLSYIDEEMDNRYRDSLKNLISYPLLIKEKAEHFPLVYSALHGTGGQVIPKLLQHYGFKVLCVEEQQSLDGNFPTLKSPNPEEKEAFTMALVLARKTQAPLVLVTDPDADRIGLAFLHNNDYQFLNGNQMGSLVLNYMCQKALEQGVDLKQKYFVNTVVSSPSQNQIAQSYGLKNFSVLTGFKNIAQVMKEQGEEDYLFSCEESYGMLLSPLVRDKDALSAALVLAEMALFYFNEQQTLQDALDNLYKQYGYFTDGLLSYTFEGLEGMEQIKALMQQLRDLEPSAINPLFVYKIDYTKDNTGLKSTNMLAFSDGNFNKIMVRPSGTEPKIKFYLSAYSPNSGTDATARLQELQHCIEQFLQ